MMLVSDEPSLDPDGTLANWQSPQTVLRWSLRLSRGRWQIAIETRSRMHGLAWQGGLTVEAAFNGQTLQQALDADRITADKYYASAESDLGAFDIAEDTDGDFALRTVAPGPEATGMMNFVKLIIRKTSV